MPFHTKNRFYFDLGWQLHVLSIPFKFIGLHSFPPLLLRSNSVVILNFPDSNVFLVLICEDFYAPITYDEEVKEDWFHESNTWNMVALE